MRCHPTYAVRRENYCQQDEDDVENLTYHRG